MILNFGSINIDNVYQVLRFPNAGETISAKGLKKVLGGKGINQTIAAQRAGAAILHIGHVGEDEWILDQLSKMGVDKKFIYSGAGVTGHAIIYVNLEGENEIVLHAGANEEFKHEKCDEILDEFIDEKPWVILQNEINLSLEIAIKAKQLGFKVCYSAAPFSAESINKILPYVDLLAMNETEMKELQNSSDKNVVDFGVAMTLVTLGSRGAELYIHGEVIKQSSFDIKPVDTTGAGDTFLGSFIARYDCGESVKSALQYASGAAAIQITRMGAAPAIPTYNQVEEFLNEKLQ